MQLLKLSVLIGFAFINNQNFSMEKTSKANKSRPSYLVVAKMTDAVTPVQMTFVEPYPSSTASETTESLPVVSAPISDTEPQTATRVSPIDSIFVSIPRPSLFANSSEEGSDSTTEYCLPKSKKAARIKSSTARNPSATALAAAGGTKSDDSDSEKPTIYTGSLPDIKTIQSGYKPSRVDITWWFTKTLEKLRKNDPVESRDIEKACAEALNHRTKYTPNDVAELSKLIMAKKIAINHIYWGDLHQAGELNKQEQCLLLSKKLEREIAIIQNIHDGMIAAADGYGRLNGKAMVSPRAEYGLGSKFDEKPVASIQQAIAKIFEVAKHSRSLDTGTGTGTGAGVGTGAGTGFDADESE